MENLYDISKECKILDSEINRYSFLLECDDSIIDNYYLTGDSLFFESEDDKKVSPLRAMIEAIKRFITKCKARFFKLIGSDKYKEYEKELSENKELANKEVKFNSRKKEFEILEKDTKDANNVIEKIKNGTATDEDIEKLEKQISSHKGLAILGIVGGVGATVTVGELIKNFGPSQKKEEEKIDDDFKFILQPSLLDPNKTLFSDKQIQQFKKAIAAVKDNIEERNKLLLKTHEEANSILDRELKSLLKVHGDTSYDGQKLAEKQLTVTKNQKTTKQHDIEKFKERTARSDFARDNYDTYHKDKSDDEKQEMAKKLRSEIADSEDYRHSKSLKEHIQDKAALTADHIVYRADYKKEKKLSHEERVKKAKEASEKKREEREIKKRAREEKKEKERMQRR